MLLTSIIIGSSRILGYHSGGCEGFGLLGYNVSYSPLNIDISEENVMKYSSEC
jgi:hypothetical protein